MASKKSSNNDLKQADLLYRQKKYGQVISLLSPQIFLYRKEPRYHELLAYSCLQTGDFGGAYSYFQRSKDLDGQRIPTLLGLAVVMLRRRQIPEALRLWLEVLDIDPSNRRAKKALELAKLLEEDDWLNMIEENRLAGILPPRPLVNWQSVLKILLPAVILAAIGLATWLVLPTILSPASNRPGQQLLNFALSDYSRDEYSNFSQIVFTDPELEREIEAVQRAFHKFNDNLVRYHGNRILLSNAPIDIKDRIALLIGQLDVPDFTNFSHGFKYSEVIEDPLLYNGVYVQWRGRVANLEISEGFIDFELLVGFESGRVLEGRVPVRLDFAAELQGGESVEIIAQVLSENSQLRLLGSFLRIIRESNP